ncbi:hypothetical protein BH23CHL1_BH23CHL1_16750 [soil metagenome]
MYTLNTHFIKLLDTIKPPQHRLDAASQFPTEVRTFLKRHEEFATIEPHSLLAGSYAQHLSVGDVKDVDFLVFVPGSPSDNDPQATDVIRDLKRALEGLPGALGYIGYSAVSVNGARRSVHVYLEDHDFHIDAVPVIAPNGIDKPLFVPDRGWNTWVESHPLGYINLISNLDSTHGGKVRRLGKLLKYFRDHHMKIRKPKSYWLGALLVDHIQRKNGLDMSQPLGALFRDLVECIYDDFDELFRSGSEVTPTIPDPMLGHDITWNWERTHFDTFMRRVDNARTWCNRALEAEDRETAISCWQRVFGDAFPSTVEDKLAELATSATPGTSSVRPSGLVVPAGSVGATRTRKTTFYGDDES